MLVCRDADQGIVAYDVATGQELRRCRGHQGAVVGLAVAADGRSFASASADTTALVWDLAGVRPKERLVGRKLTEKEMQSFWNDLASPQGVKGHAAVQGLVAVSGQTVKMLEGLLRPVAPGSIRSGLRPWWGN